MNLAQTIEFALKKEQTKKDYKGKIKELKQRKSELLREKKKTNKQLFKITSGRELSAVSSRIENLKARDDNKLTFDFPNKKLSISKDYLKSLKDPEKYVMGLYGRELRREQKKAHESGNFNQSYGLKKKLDLLKQKQGLTRTELKETEQGKFSYLENLKNKGIINKKTYDTIIKKDFKKSKEESGDTIVTISEGQIELLYV